MVRRQLEPLDRISVLDGEQVGLLGKANIDCYQRLARRIEAEGAVLLRNDESLPIDIDDIDSIAVISDKIKSAIVRGDSSSDVTLRTA